MHYDRIIYLGDGANDFCPALTLTAGDVVLARKNYDLDQLIQKRNADVAADRRVDARVATWETHEQLFLLVQQYVTWPASK